MDDNPVHWSLSYIIFSFMQNRHHGTTAFGLIARDAWLLDMIVMVASGSDVSTLAIERNATLATTGEYHPDAYIYFPGTAPIVFMEEKDVDSKLDLAISELADKFVLAPAYGLSYVLGIAVAGNMFAFVKLTGNREKKVLVQLNVTNEYARVQCVLAAIHVGRWCKSVGQRSGALHVIEYQYNKLYTDERRTLKIGYTSVEKVYLNLSEVRRAELLAFYAISSRPYIESALSTREIGNELHLQLMPVGLPGLPTSEGEVRLALACIFIATCHMHSQGWSLLDLRWPNIVRLNTSQGYRYYIIDGECATRFGNPLPEIIQGRLRSVDYTSVVASSCCDWLMISAMIREANQCLNNPSRNLLHLAHWLRDQCKSSSTSTSSSSSSSNSDPLTIEMIKAQPFFSGTLHIWEELQKT